MSFFQLVNKKLTHLLAILHFQLRPEYSRQELFKSGNPSSSYNR